MSMKRSKEKVIMYILFAAGCICLLLAGYLGYQFLLYPTVTGSETQIVQPNPIFTFLLVYGYPMLIAAIILAYLGVPLPLNAVLLSAGALAQHGPFTLIPLIIIAAVMAILGDSFNYYIGKRLRYFKHHKHIMRISLPDAHLEEIDKYFRKWGIWSVFLTRWLLTPLGIPVNLVAGMRKYSFKEFLVFVSLGEVIWACLYIYAGYVFSQNWTLLWGYINNAPLVLALLLVGIGCLGIGFKMFFDMPRSARLDR